MGSSWSRGVIASCLAASCLVIPLTTAEQVAAAPSAADGIVVQHRTELANGFADVVTQLGDEFGATIDGYGSMPLVGDQISSLQRRIAEPFDGVSALTRFTIEDVLDEASRSGTGGVDLVTGALYITLGPGPSGLSDLPADVATALEPFVAGTDGLGILGDRNGDLSVTPADIGVTHTTAAGQPEVEFNVQLTDTIAASLPFQLGIELDPNKIAPDFDVVTSLASGAGLDVASSVQVDLGWTADLRFGVSTADGFYITDDLGPVFQAGIFGSVPNLDLDASVGLFAVRVTDGTSQAGVIQRSEIRTNLALRLEPAVGATTPNRMLAARVERVENEKFAQIRLNVEPRSSLGLVVDGVPVELPEISFELEADIDKNDEGKFRPTSVRFDDVTLNVAQTLRTLGGTLGKFADRALTPVSALDDALNARIPGISDITDSRVTLNDALPAEARAFFADVRRLTSLQATMYSAANSAPTAFSFGCVDVVQTLPGKNYGPCIGEGYNLQYDSSAVPGIVKVHLFELETIVRMLAGKTAPLASAGIPELDARGGADYGVNVAPFSFGVKGELDVKADLRLVFDSLGLERAIAVARTGQVPDPALLLDGLYVQNNATGFEVGVRASYSGSASKRVREFGVTVFSAGATVDARAALGFELVDPDRNGQFRYAEMAALTNNFSRPQNLACVFDFQASADSNVSAYANGFGFGGTIDLGWPGPDISLQDLLAGTTGCKGIVNSVTSGQRVLATPIRVSGDRWLRLNVGAASEARRYGNTDDSRGFAVYTWSVGNDVIVWFDGTQQRFTGPFSGVTVLGDAGHDLIAADGLTIPISADGAGGHDTITGGSAADDLVGSGGNDALWGNGGDDRIDGGLNDDLVRGGVGDDVLNGGAGNDDLAGDDGNDVIDGDAGNDRADGGTGNDDLRGESGADRLVGGEGDDTLSGGDDDDTLDGGEGDDTANGGDGNDTIDGGPGIDRLGGGPGADTLRAGTGDDTAAGGPGADRIDGGDGNDFLRGGTGNDTVNGDDGDDRVDGGLDDDTLSGGSGNDRLDGGEGDDGIRGDDGTDTITGSLGNDNIDGGSERDLLRGNAGDDTIRGGTGDDTIDGDDGNDALHGDAGNDAISGDAGDDTITGGDDDDVLDGDDGNDTISGDGGNDLINGHDGDDTIDGGANADVIDAGDDDDVVNGGTGADLIDITQGNNTARGGADDDRIIAGPGNDTIHGDGGNDVIEAGNGTNTVTGGDDDDLITTGSGNDTIDGDRGVDVIRSNTGDDTVTGDPGDDLVQAGGEAGDEVIIDARRDPFPVWSLRDGVMITAGGHTLSVGGSDSLTIRLDGDDALIIDDGALPLDIESFGGITTVRSISFPVDVVGAPTAGDRLVVESPAVSSGRRATLSPGQVLGVAEAPVTYAGVDTLALMGSGGADQLDVTGGVDTTTFVEFGDGDDLINLTVPTPIVALGVDGQAGDDTARVTATGDPAAAAGLTGVGFTAFELLDIDGSGAIGTDWAFDDLAVNAGTNRILTTTDGVETVRYLGGTDPDSLAVTSTTPVSQTVTIGGDQAEIVEGFDTHEFDSFGLNAGTGAGLIARRNLLLGADPATGTIRATDITGGAITPLAAPAGTGALPSADFAVTVPPAVAGGSYNNGSYEYYRDRDFVVIAHGDLFGHGRLYAVYTYRIQPDGSLTQESVVSGLDAQVESGTDYLDANYNSFILGVGSEALVSDAFYPDTRSVPLGADIRGVALHASEDWGYAATDDGRVHWFLNPVFVTVPVQGSAATSVTDITMVDVIGDRLIVAGANRIEIYDIVAGVPTLTDTIINGVDGARGVNDVRAVAFQGDTMFVASESADSVAVFQRDGGTYRFRQVFQDLANGVRGIANPVTMFVHDGALFVSGASTGTSGEDIARFLPLTDPPTPRVNDIRFDTLIDTVSVASGGQGDRVVARDINRPLAVDSGAGPDVVGAGFFATDQVVSIDSGEGADVVRIKTTGVDADVDVDAGAGDDDVTIGATSVGASTDVDLGTGADTVSVFGDHLDAPVTISPSTDPGDTLRFFSSVTPTPANPPTPDGTVTHPTHQRVDYVGIEAIDVLAPPIAALAAVTTVEGGSVTFDNTGTIIPSGRTATYEWDLDGDGFVGDAVGENVTVAWNDLVAAGIDDDGVYPITVRVTTDLGDYDEFTAPLTVTDLAPVGTITPVDPNGVEGQPVFLDISVTDPGDDRVASWIVDWGDGIIEEILSLPPAGGVPHVYADDGATTARTLTVTLVSITNDDGTFAQTSTTAFQIANVTPPDLVATGPATVDEEAVYTLQLASNTPDVFDEPILIDWGDGEFDRYDAATAGTRQTQFTHRFSTPGVFQVSALVAGSPAGVGRVEAAPVSVTVTDVAPTLTLAGPTSTPEGSYTLDLSAAGNDPVFRWDVDWGDGSAPDTALGATASLTHVFDGPSTPTIRVTAHDIDGTTVATKPITVTNATPAITSASIAAGAVEGGAAEVTVVVDDVDELTYVLRTSGGDVVGTNRTGRFAVPITDDGPLTFAVTVTDDDGAIATAPINGSAANVAPTVDVAAPPSVVEGTTATVAFTVVDPGDDTATSVRVDWGAGPTDLAVTDGVATAAIPALDGPSTINVDVVSVTDEDATHPIGDSVTIDVTDSAPRFEIVAPDAVEAGDAFALATTVVTDAGIDTVTSATIDWGDGSVEVIAPQPDGSFAATHVYAGTVDTATVSMFVTSDDGDSPAQTHDVDVQRDPVADDEAGELDEDTTLRVDVLDGDTDPDDDLDPRSVILLGTPDVGSAIVDSSGSVVYEPPADYDGADFFEYRVCDASGLCDVGRVDLVVNGIDDAPVATDIGGTTLSFTVAEDEELRFEPTEVVTDPDDEPVTMTRFDTTSAEGGTIREGSLIYRPAPDFNGSDSFTFDMRGDGGASATFTVDITVTAAPDAPRLFDAAGNRVTSLDIAAAVGAPIPALSISDPDGDAFTVTVTSGELPSGVQIANDGSFVGNPVRTSSGIVTIEVCDTGGACATFELDIEVMPGNGPSGGLPATGTSTTPLALRLATWSVLLGAAVLLIVRRRRRPVA